MQIDTEKVKQDKRRAEGAIAGALQEFSNATGLGIKGISVHPVRQINGQRTPSTYLVTLNIELDI